MATAVVIFTLLSSIGQVQSDSQAVDINDTCGGCVCDSPLDTKDLWIGSSVPERQLDDSEHTSDEHSSGEHSSDEHSSGEHSSDEHSSGEHSSGEHSSGEHSSDEHSSGEHTSDEHSSGEHSSGEHSSGEHTSGEHTSGEHTSDEHTSGEHTSGEHSSGEHSSGEHSSDEHTSDEHSSGEHSSDEHSSGEHSSGEHSSGEHTSGEHSSDEHSSGEHSSGEHTSDEHSSGEHGSDEHSSGDHGHDAGHSSGHESSHSAGHESSHSAGHGSSHSAGHDSSHSAGHGSSHSAGHGSSHSAGHGSSHSAGHGSGHGSGHGGGHGHHQWWEHRYEYEHFEAWVIVALVLITFFFDSIHHHLAEKAAEAGHHGNLLHMRMKTGVKKIHTSSLWQDLHNRCSTELAVLGFLALLVWSCNQAGLFDDLHEADFSTDGLKVPDSGTAYLHEVEAVHMHLFIAMCWYFAFLCVMVAVATDWTARAVDANFNIKNAYKEGRIPEGEEENFYRTSEIFFRNFFMYRQYFFISLQQWRGQWPFLDTHIQNFLDDLVTDAKKERADNLTDDKNNNDEMGAAPSFQNVKTEDMKQKTMPELMARWFPFDLYVVVNYRHTMDELIEVKSTTWLMILFFLLTQAMTQRAAKDDFPMTAVWVCVCQVMLIGITIACFFLHRTVRRTVLEEYSDRKPATKWVHKCRPVRSLVRLIQCGVFFTFYDLSSVVATKAEWEANWKRPFGFLMLLIFGGITEGIILGMLLPLYSVLVSTGPMMQEKHVIRLQEIIKAYAHSSPKQIRQLAMNIEEFDEQADEEEESLKEKLEHPESEGGNGHNGHVQRVADSEP